MKALILINLQYDYMPGGPMAVPNGDEVIGVANRLLESGAFGCVAAIQDWHPPRHKAFAQNHKFKRVGDKVKIDNVEQVLSPRHCVENTRGSSFVEELLVEKIDEIFRTGTNESVDSYSGFFDKLHKRATGLSGYLKRQKVTEIYLVGLPTEEAIKNTALDSKELGFPCFVIEDACRGGKDAARALDEIRRNNITFVSSSQFAQSAPAEQAAPVNTEAGAQ